MDWNVNLVMANMSTRMLVRTHIHTRWSYDALNSTVDLESLTVDVLSLQYFIPTKRVNELERYHGPQVVLVAWALPRRVH